ncbi:hypothetical protein HU200_053370 [Digitaria exilis]|uniref:DUF569 domain-containing protein n=1 Tax=Digitaria exilis TaxID=1010633 RepID=A0A835AP87_9POAL|nr:hypothetical protein HU200_053370 [Digitaria exilis]
MDVFNGVRFVRLRCSARRGKYLAADVDGLGVCLTSQRSVHNVVWAVHHAPGPDGGPCVLLRGAYGRYLIATSVQAGTGPTHGVLTTQDDLAHAPPPPGMLWQAIPRRSTFVMRSGTGRYLRANGRYLRWRRAVTSAGDNGSTMMQWDIENVPIRMSRPCILDPVCQVLQNSPIRSVIDLFFFFQEMARVFRDPTIGNNNKADDGQLTHPRRRPLTESEVARQIRFVRGEINGDVNEGAWRTMRLNTHNLMQLRLTLACRLGASRDVTRTTLCIRAGRFGHLSPLLVDLPIGNNRIDIVILNHGTQGQVLLQLYLRSWFLHLLYSQWLCVC